MKTNTRRSTALLAASVLALGGLTACEDDGGGIEDDVEQDVEEDINNVQDEFDGEPDDGGEEE